MYKIDNQIKKVWNFCEWKCNVPTYNVQYVLETSQKGKKPVKTPLPGLQYRYISIDYIFNILKFIICDEIIE